MRPSDGLDGETRDPLEDELSSPERPALTLTIAHHPDPARIGDRAFLDDHRFAISRLEPELSHPRKRTRAPIADSYVSRAPIEGRIERGTLILSGNAIVDGQPLEGERRIDATAIERGIVLELQKRVVLVLHRARRDPVAPTLDLVGESDGVQQLRREITRVAPRDVNVLVRGETGTGKELVARAIHASRARRSGPFVAVSMAAVAPQVAASELFGHRKGAFTGATSDRAGCFRSAHGGTLFLDEIGECPIDLQVALLRAIDSGRVQPVGADADEAVDVRLVTATDANLELAAQQGRFRAPLLHRLAGYELFLPPLRARREDIGRLLASFLSADELRALPAAAATQLMSYDWPGNVRQLKNVAAQLALSLGEGPAEIQRILSRLGAPPSSTSGPEVKLEPKVEVKARRKPATVSGEELRHALERNQWKIDRAAAELGISRPSIYRLIDADPTQRKAKDLSREELRSAVEAAGGDLDRASEQLKVSKAGLRLRLKEEGLA